MLLTSYRRGSSTGCTVRGPRRPAQAGGDSGNALTTVVVLVVVTGIIAAALAGLAVSVTGFTSAGRASVQARAAAEGGIDAVRAALPGCTSGTFTSAPSTTPAYVVTVSYRASAGAGWTAGCPTSAATEVLLVSTGYPTGQAAGTGSSAGTRTMEAVLTASPPQFRHAIAGEGKITSSGGTTVTSASGPVDVATKGDYSCSGATSQVGSLYVGGTLSTSARCDIQGNVYVGGDFSCSAGLTIGGDLSVRGSVDLSADCRVNGRLWVGGTLRTAVPTTVGKDLWVVGDLVGAPPIVHGFTVRVGGSVLSGAKAAYGALLTNPDATLTRPTGLAGYDPADPTSFPRVTADDARWAAWRKESWESATRSVRPSGTSACSITSAWTRTLTITQNTVLDSRTDCPSGISVVAGYSISLGADLAILVNGYSQSGGTVTVTSSSAAERSLSLVNPWTAALSAPCPGAVPSLVFSGTTTWSQPDDRTRILLYSGAGVTSSGAMSVRGQVYGCTTTNSARLTVRFAHVGATTASSGGSPLRLASKREVTG